MGKTVEELELELKLFLEEKETSTKKKKLVKIDKFLKKNVKALVKDDVKALVKDDVILGLLNEGLKQTEIAKRCHLTRSAISQRINSLKKKGLLSKDNSLKKVVKDLALPMTSKPNYEFQTLQIIIPLLHPEIIDFITWDKILPQIRQSFKKYKNLKFTLNRTTKSIRLFLHRRYIERPEQVKDICREYVSWCEEHLKKYDIELDTAKAECKGLHLWTKDQKIEENYSKDDGTIGVYHGQPSAKVLPNDDPKERKTWVDSTPTPDGIESNDYSYFNDKKSMEFFVGVPKGTITEYLLKPTEFIKAMEKLTSTSETQVKAIELEIKNKQEHMALLKDIGIASNKQTNLMNELLGLIKMLPDIILRSSKEKQVEQILSKPDSTVKEITCPICHASFSSKLLKARDFICPNSSCFANLKLYFPDI